MLRSAPRGALEPTVERLYTADRTLEALVGSRYGVRPRKTSALEDQLGLVPGPKSKIGDGSDMGTLCTHVTAVGRRRFLKSSVARALADPPTFTTSPPPGRPVGASLEAM